MAHAFQTDDPRLNPIAEKVMAGARLDSSDALALFRSHDVLAMGWLANHVRELMHGNVAYFNVNRHINPTNVCVAACRLCAFGRKKDAPGAYTMALEEAFETAASGYTEATVLPGIYFFAASTIMTMLAYGWANQVTPGIGAPKPVTLQARLAELTPPTPRAQKRAS